MASNSMAEGSRSVCLHKFRLYETRSKFYLTGRDKRKTLWKVLKISKTEPCELNILEDASTYTETECEDFLNRVDEGNKSTGGLRFITCCYGIVGFIKFFGPYYMLLITKRKQIGTICGHAVYAVAKSEIITIGNSSLSLDVANCGNESRYKKLFCAVDLTKDFFFSYSYPIMHSLQKNFGDGKNGKADEHGSMFVWNGFLSRGLRNQLKNNFWTVSLVHGFFKQAKLSVSGRDFILTLIARRSRHYAGTRFLRRGVNERGRVANDVETEQIVSENECRCGQPIQMSSVVQNRGSIPLFWSQETSRLYIQPEIMLHKKNRNYEATRLHFENLAERYGNPIIILNLIKTNEKRPRESVLRAEFERAIDTINKDLPGESRLRFLHWDLQSHFKKKSTNVLGFLGRVAECAMKSTGLFYCKSTARRKTDDVAQSENEDAEKCCSTESTQFQSGVLRTNCIDCLDRTNVAQFMYGLAAFGNQLHELRLIDEPQIDLHTPLAEELMRFYEAMGDSLALQYGGSAAHNKIFGQWRGQWKVMIQSQELFRTLQRYYSNAYVDAEKQDAINVFLGHLRPLHGGSSLWGVDSDLHWNVEGCHHRAMDHEDDDDDDHRRRIRSIMERSLSDGTLESSSSVAGESALTTKELSSSAPVIPCHGDTSDSRVTPSAVCQREVREGEGDRLIEHRVDHSTSSNFMELAWISSEESSPSRESTGETATTARENETVLMEPSKIAVEWADDAPYQNEIREFSQTFAHWVDFGGMLYR